jgi:DNA adenine methylase
VNVTDKVSRVVARPVVKWAGGKSKLAPMILEMMPARIARYHEPFCGGAAVFFALQAERRVTGRMFLNDVNSTLIDAYRAIKGNVERLIGYLHSVQYRNDADSFAHVRQGNMMSSNLFERAADFIYLNKTCFNGLFRVNRSGQFNTPFGCYLNPTICDEENLRAASAVLQWAFLDSLDYERAVHDVIHGDVVYFDPPYIPVAKTANFTSYTRAGFGYESQRHLQEVAFRLKKRGAIVILSNSDTDVTREIYKKWRFREVQAARAINSNPDKRGAVKELIIY